MTATWWVHQDGRLRLSATQVVLNVTLKDGGNSVLLRVVKINLYCFIDLTVANGELYGCFMRKKEIMSGLLRHLLRHGGILQMQAEFNFYRFL